MADKIDVWLGTMTLMVLKTLQVMGPMHGYGIARRIEQTSGGQLLVNYGTLYPALLRMEQEGYISSEWEPRITIAGRSSTVSRGRAAGIWKKKRKIGERLRWSWAGSWIWKRIRLENSLPSTHAASPRRLGTRHGGVV